MIKNKLCKLGNNQSTKQVSITIKKNKLFKQDNNQSADQVSITMQYSRIVACHLTKNKHTLRNLLSTQGANYRTLFLPVQPSEACSECTKTPRFWSHTYINLITWLKRIVMIFLKILEPLKSKFRISSETHSKRPKWNSLQKWSTVLNS